MELTNDIMKHLLSPLVILAFVFCPSCGQKTEDPYAFNGKISQQVLDNYLSRAITMAEFLTVDPYCIDGNYPDKQADIDLIKNTGAKFIGRAIYRWGHEEVLNEPAFWDGAKSLIDQVHAFDPDIIFQAGVFEAVYRNVEQVPVPEWVFHALGLPAEKRNFQYDSMLFPNGRWVGMWGPDGSVPDIRQVETQLWLMYLIGSYVDIGVEAIHMGQVMLMGAEDENWASWDSFLSRVRDYVYPRARRHFVLFDAHGGENGMIVDGGRSLLDFNAFPLRIKEVVDKPMEGMLEVGHLDALYRKSPACTTPSGWACESLPYLVEFDNFGVSDHPGKANLNDHFIWGYDEISWFWQLSPEEKDAWLKYAYGWIKENDPAGHLEMPGARVVTLGNGSPAFMCRAVSKSDRIPYGMGIEGTIRELWNDKSDSSSD